MKNLSKFFGVIIILALFLIVPSCGENGDDGASLEDCQDACEILESCGLFDEPPLDIEDFAECLDCCEDTPGPFECVNETACVDIMDECF